MKKVEILQTNRNNTVGIELWQEYYKDEDNCMKLHKGISIEFERSSIILDSPEEVDEFCELLQEKKKEIWNQK